MEKNHLDRIIKDALENFEVDYTQADWEAMQQRLELEELTDSPEMEDVFVDAVTYGSMENLEVPYEAAHWEQMSARLDEEFAFHKTVIYRYKIAEVALMLLAILTLVQFLPLKKQQGEPLSSVASEQLLTPQAEANHLMAESTGTSTIAIQSEAKNNITEAKSDNSTLAANQTLAKLETLSNVSTSVKNEYRSEKLPTNSIKQRSQALSDLSQVPLPLAKIEQLNSNNEITIESLGRIDKKNALSANALQQYNTGLLLPATLKNAFERLAIYPAWVTETEKELGYDCTLCEAKKLIGLNVGMFGSSDINVVFTPYDEVFKLDSYTNTAQGYSGGLSFGLSIGRWEIQTGLIYSAKTYQPLNLKEETYGNFDVGYVTERFGEFELDMLQIPFNVQFQMNKESRWRFYSLAGVSLNTALQASYGREIEAEGGFGYLGVGGGRDPNPKDPSFDLFRNQEAELVTKKDSNLGWFEGGTFKENSYMTSNAGLGLERLLSPRWSVYVEPSYRFHLLSFNKAFNIGPNNDRINTVMLKTGVKVNLR